MEFISIVPNTKTSIELDPEIINLISSSDEDNVSRIIIQDNNGYGICLPALINKEENIVEFVLPQQLCIFLASETYLCKFECILENQIIVPFISDAKIDLKDDGGDEIEDSEEESEDEFGSNTEAFRDSLAAEDDMDSILDAIAPKAEDKSKKTLVEDIIKNLDEEFVKQALWLKEQKSQTIPLVREQQILPPQPVQPVSKERLVLKSKMKNILLNMLK